MDSDEEDSDVVMKPPSPAPDNVVPNRPNTRSQARTPLNLSMPGRTLISTSARGSGSAKKPAAKNETSGAASLRVEQKLTERQTRSTKDVLDSPSGSESDSESDPGSVVSAIGQKRSLPSKGMAVKDHVRVKALKLEDGSRHQIFETVDIMEEKVRLSLQEPHVYYC